MCSDANFPGRLAYRLIDEASLIVKKSLDGGISERNSNTELLKLVEKYDDPSSQDKLSMASNKVEEVKLKLNDNLTNLVQNQVNIDVYIFELECRSWINQNERDSRTIRKRIW